MSCNFGFIIFKLTLKKNFIRFFMEISDHESIINIILYKGNMGLFDKNFLYYSNIFHIFLYEIFYLPLQHFQLQKIEVLCIFLYYNGHIHICFHITNTIVSCNLNKSYDYILHFFLYIFYILDIFLCFYFFSNL